MTPATLRVAFDSGWSIGSPGAGRLRFDTPRLAKARFLCIGNECALGTTLDDVVPAWGRGDVIVVERVGQEVNRIVAWVVGPVRHGGSYWQVPIAVRSVFGSFAANDELLVHHHGDAEIEDEQAVPATLSAPPVIERLPSLGAGNSQVTYTPTPMAPLAPIAAEPQHLVSASGSEPQDEAPAPMAPMSPAVVADSRLAALEAENQRLHVIIARLISDETELYVVEGSQ